MSVTTAAPQAIPAGTWRVDPVHSTVGFQVDYMVGAFRGQFHDVTATLEVGSGGSVLTGSARVSSVDAKDETLAAHLQSPDFFDAERYPELLFESADIELSGDRVRVRGEITIKGVTRAVELEGSLASAITDPYGRERIGLRLGTAIDRTDFGLDWNAPLPSGDPALSNEVALEAELYFVREA
jgi:polyisoprenoid-binding protein YceI